MNKCLYIFGYETPQQHLSNLAHGFDDENSCSVFIVGSTESEALEWGREISEVLVANLFQDKPFSWKNMDYSHGIESMPLSTYTDDELAAIPVVQVGQAPAFRL